MWWIAGSLLLLSVALLYYLDNLKFGVYSRISKPTKQSNIIQEDDLSDLPIQMQRYLAYVGVIGKEKPNGMKLKLSGEMKANKTMDFAKAKAKQTSMFGPYKRYFYMELKMHHLVVKGLHVFHHGMAIMKIKVLGLFRVVNGKGEKMNQAETVTVLNDMCLLAPHALLNAPISYREISENVLHVTFVNEGIKVEANLYFGDDGRLINFVSNDRYYSQDGQENIAVPWATPIYEYKDQHGFYLPYKGDAVWMFEDEQFTYFKLTVDEIQFIS